MSAQEKAADLLIFYMRHAWEAAGKKWELPDNSSEVRAIVDLIIDACSERDYSKARQARYVIADGGRYAETRITLVPTVDGNAVVYEGSGTVTGPVFEGPAYLAERYASDRDADLTAKGYVKIREG